MAAEGGHLDILRWASDNGCDWGIQVFVFAARKGRLAVLKWALERAKGKVWVLLFLDNEELCLFAAAGGHLETLKLLVANKYPWGLKTWGMAIMGGDLGVIRWMNENGCVFQESTCTIAARAGKLEVLLPEGYVACAVSGRGRMVTIGAKELTPGRSSPAI